MENTEVTRAPRFMNTDAKVIYDLFDAFVKATLVDDRAIDFSKPVMVTEDGSLEFATRDEKFSDIISGDFNVQVVKAPRKPAKPSQAQMESYNAQVDEADAKRAALLQSKGLLYAHLNWLWTLGANNMKTSCGADNLKALGIEKEEGAAFTGKTGLWKASAGSSQKELSLICNVLFRFATTTPQIKALFTTVEEVKQCLVNLAWKVKSYEKNNARHGLLHLCDPDNYIGLYSAEAKIQWINDSHVSRKDFVDPYNKCDQANAIYYKDEKLGYRYPTTDALICFIEDKKTP